ncbi:MAG: DJ-1/PfpI/YhbO family deglycase/protease [Deltaproteobacteria bacterium]|nr:DJ-1/PfpI/YhbO family deglycase/protease [Deltaproteobacteria bacterium]
MKRALIITGRKVQDHEFIYPYYRLQEEGFALDVAIRNKETVMGILGTTITPTRDITGIDVKDYSLLVLPGGAKAMEYIRQDQEVINFITNFNKTGKVIAAICHGTQLLISANIVKGRNVSGYYSIKDDVNNAGAKYIDAPYVTDENLITSPHYKYLGDWMRETFRVYKTKN